MSDRSVRIGEIELITLVDGDGHLDEPIESSFPGVPDAAWDEVKRAHPLLLGARGVWRLRVRCTLIRIAGRTILVDTGVGPAEAPAFSWYHRPGRLPEELEAVGVAADEVNTIVITHVHDDHIGGTARGGRPSFPEARYVVQRADLEAQWVWAKENAEDATIAEALLRPLEVAGVLDVVDGDAELAPGVKVRLAPGHTPGHQVIELESDGAVAMITGDTFNFPIQLAEPEWYSGSDHDPPLANSTRKRIVGELAGANILVVPSHFAEPFGHVATGSDDRPAWVPLADP